MTIYYVKGDATKPVAPLAQNGIKFIPHVCNDVGVWGAGFVLAISKRWPEPEQQYKDWVHTSGFQLGRVQTIKVEKDIYVCNMIAQAGVGIKRSYTGPISPLQYEYLLDCLRIVGQNAFEADATIHMPRIGCGLAGGRWDLVELLINTALADHRVYVYDL